MKKTARTAAIVGIAALVLAGCGSRPSDTPTAATRRRRRRAARPRRRATRTSRRAMVSDSGGFDDKSFNQTSLKGLTDAEGRPRHPDRPGRVELRRASTPTTSTRWSSRAATRSSPSASCSVTPPRRPPRRTRRSTSRSSTSATTKAARRTSRASPSTPPQPSFLAGYLAAAHDQDRHRRHLRRPEHPAPSPSSWTASARASQYYNKQNGKNVQVLGWDEQQKTARSPNTFDDKTKGQSVAESMIQQGADIIFPVAGPAGLGGLPGRQGQGRQRDLGRHRRLRLGRRVLRVC